MRTFLTLLFSTILVGMLVITVIASMERSIVDAGRELLPDRWFQATLLDAYFGFITVYVWVAYRECTLIARIVWFVLIMTLGNIAISIYLLIQLWQTRGDGSLHRLLAPRQASV